MAALYVLSSSGDQRVTWDRERLEVRDPEALSAIAAAEALFARERARGSSAFKVLPGQPAQRLDVFDDTADEIVIVPRMAGGA
ncbi:MAG: hypothetical protein ACRDHX_17395 [Chloroflexota bacterium]